MTASRASDKRWAAASLAALGFFAWWEGDAYAKKDSDATMTYWWRRVLGIAPSRRRRFVLVPILWLFSAWFPIHISYNVLGVKVNR